MQKFLTEYNKPSFESFYEEMLSRRREREMQEAEMQKNEEDIEVMFRVPVNISSKINFITDNFRGSFFRGEYFNLKLME